MSAQESSVPKSTEKQTEWSMKLRKSWSSNRESLGAEFPDRSNRFSTDSAIQTTSSKKNVNF